jgi:hypothetical protein
MACYEVFKFFIGSRMAKERIWLRDICRSDVPKFPPLVLDNRVRHETNEASKRRNEACKGPESAVTVQNKPAGKTEPSSKM